MPFMIVGGPNKFDLLNSHSVTCNRGQPITVEFDLELAGVGFVNSSRNIAVIRGLEWEDSDRESWIIKADMVFYPGWRTVVGVYNTKTRKGTLQYL